jgi:hypothetical protein
MALSSFSNLIEELSYGVMEYIEHNFACQEIKRVLIIGEIAAEKEMVPKTGFEPAQAHAY